MLHEFKNELGGNFVYWSNSCGDLHHNGEYDIEKVEDLPTELQRAFNELWCEGIYGVRCYLVEFNGKYGIAFEAGYSKCYADDLGMTYENLVKVARKKAVECSKKFPEYDVVFGEDAEPWSDGSADSIVTIIMPWDISNEKFDEVGKYFESMCYEISNEENNTNTRRITTRLNFFWDDNDDIQEFIIIVPENVSDEEVAKALSDAHDFLCSEDNEDIYGTSGKTPGTLVNYVCEKSGWEWRNMEFDIDFNFD